MNTKIIIVLTFFINPLLADAQLTNFGKKLKEKVERKVTQRVDTKTDKAIDQALDDVEGKVPKKKEENAAESAAPSKGTSAPAINIYSKFDFVPGEQILYADDFASENIGELPLHWNTSGKGEIVTLEEKAGRWLRLHQNTSYLSANKKEFTKNFTVEFDLILQFSYKSYTFPLVTFGLLSSNTLETTSNELLSAPSTFNSALVELRPYKDGASFSFNSFTDAKKYFNSSDQKLKGFEKNYHNTAHVSMQAQEGRLRIWMNSEKIFDMPKALAGQYPFNQLFFKIHNSGYTEDQIGFYISNLKVATGVPDTRHKLLEEGSFSTNGILFDHGSAVIKLPSYGIIKEIATVLKNEPTLKIRIVGHTSSDGDDQQNMTLSQKRSEAVKNLIQNEFGIEENRMQTEGKGETFPVADNKTPEGKLLNRRVEFIKL